MEPIFSENSPEEFFLQRSAVVCDNCKTVTMRFRYFFSDMALGRIWSKDGTILFHLGVGKEPEPRRAEPCSMADEEFEALRLMGNPARARMLQAMMYRTMTIQELSKALGLNPGSVHRDLNSLFCAKLLVLEAVRGKTGYRTDYEKIKALTERFLQFLEQNKRHFMAETRGIDGKEAPLRLLERGFLPTVACSEQGNKLFLARNREFSDF